MLTIAFDTSTKNLSVALYKDCALLDVMNFEGEGYVHSEKLLPFIQQLLTKNKFKLSELEAILLGTGPGSYTGLRIGASAAKALSFSLDIPVYGMSSNEILYWSCLEEAESIGAGKIVTMIDARRDEVYLQVFDLNNQICGKIESKIIDQDFVDSLKSEIVLWSGDGAMKFQDRFDLGESVISTSCVINEVGQLNRFFETERLTEILLDTAYFDANYVKSYQPGKKKSLFN
jgi:tRNA threonylcarbamoyladenosine biosynthesis protein TsaB